MFRLAAPLLLLLEALVALVPAQGLLVCLGTLAAPAAEEVATACDCGHHEDAAQPPEAPQPRPGQPGQDDGSCGGCLDLEFDRTEALRPELGENVAEPSLNAATDVPCAAPLNRGQRPDLARAPGLADLTHRRQPPPRTARVLLERATIQLRL